MDGYLAEIRLFAGSYAPQNWAFCEGQILLIEQNTSLYALLGTVYGGDGVNNYALPNMKGKEPVKGLHYIICLAGMWPVRD
jgi:microcystin-dependent protein